MDTGQKQAALTEQSSTGEMHWVCWSGRGRRLVRRTAEPLCTRLLGCLIVSVCVVFVMCPCVFVQRNAHGVSLLFPQSCLFHSYLSFCLVLTLSPPNFSVRRSSTVPSADPAACFCRRVLPAALLSHFTPSRHIPRYLRGGYVPFALRGSHYNDMSCLSSRKNGGQAMSRNRRGPCGYQTRVGHLYLCLSLKPLQAGNPDLSLNQFFPTY